jgi:hypothetical protein
MLTITRSAAFRFRQVLKRSVMTDQFRSSWPTVLCRAGRNELVLESGQGGMAVRLYVDGVGSAGAIAFRADLLSKVEGREGSPVTLEPAGSGKGVASWLDGGVPKAVEFEALPVEEARAFPEEPRPTAMPENFLPALAEAIRTAAKKSDRVGLTRVLLRGKAGEMVASDSKQLLIQRGYPFPWEEDVLIPRVPALDGRPLGATGPLGIGRSNGHIFLRLPPWAFALPVDTENRFPGVESVVPRASATTSRLQFDPVEALRLAAVLPRLPGSADDSSPVTLALGQRPAVRAKGEADEEAVEVLLDRSTASGPVEAVVVNRAYLLRALALGFTEVQIAYPAKPVLCRDRKRIYVFMPLEPSAAVPPGPRLRRVPLPEAPAAAPPIVRKRASVPVAINGHAAALPAPAATADASTDRVTVADVIGEAVAVAGLLRDAAGRVSRLLAALRRQRHQTRAVQQAGRSLKQLQLAEH